MRYRTLPGSPVWVCHNNKLTSASGGGHSASFSYDSNGNPFDKLRASMTGVALKWTKWGRRLRGAAKAAKVLGRASGLVTAGFAAYYGVKCYQQTQ